MDVSTLDPETFDDSEFYSFLLKEFIESSGNTDASLYSVGWLGGYGVAWARLVTIRGKALNRHLSRRQVPKKRKVVDHRASKGRKLRYHVHQKLVNFMAPVEVEEPAFADQLFSNLFGGEGLTA